MNVIRHQNKRVNVITFPVKLQQANFDFRAHTRPPHVTRTHAGVQPFLHSVDESLLVFALFVRAPWRWMQSEPNSPFISPLMQQ